jgi:hypothetical protein
LISNENHSKTDFEKIIKLSNVLQTGRITGGLNRWLN